MALDLDLSELNLENIGSWPVPIKVAVIIILCVTLAGLTYWFDTQYQFQNLSASQHKEKELRQEFERKQYQAANLNSYKEQLAAMEKSFGTMLRQLPSETEVPGLLEDISETGVATGLEFKLFDPQLEVQHDFYAEFPIKITVLGDYHQFGEFISRVAALHRIVTLHDFKITHAPKNPDGEIKKEQSGKVLQMDITAKTYRYTVMEENSPQRNQGS